MTHKTKAHDGTTRRGSSAKKAHDPQKGHDGRGRAARPAGKHASSTARPKHPHAEGHGKPSNEHHQG